MPPKTEKAKGKAAADEQRDDTPLRESQRGGGGGPADDAGELAVAGAAGGSRAIVPSDGDRGREFTAESPSLRQESAREELLNIQSKRDQEFAFKEPRGLKDPVHFYTKAKLSPSNADTKANGIFSHRRTGLYTISGKIDRRPYGRGVPLLKRVWFESVSSYFTADVTFLEAAQHVVLHCAVARYYPDKCRPLTQLPPTILDDISPLTEVQANDTKDSEHTAMKEIYELIFDYLQKRFLQPKDSPF